MSYEANMESRNPGCIIFMIDQSGSMSTSWAGSSLSCAYGAARAVNNVITEVIARCIKQDTVTARVGFGLYGYFNDSVDWIAKDFPPNKDGIVSVVDLYKNQREKYDKDSERYIGWFVEEKANGTTPMKKAMTEVAGIARNFATKNPQAFPPIIINVTDGEPTDMSTDEIEKTASAITSVATKDGNALLWNIHISASPAPPMVLPDTQQSLSLDSFGRALFSAASRLPPRIHALANAKNMHTSSDARCFAFNGNETTLVTLLTFASSVTEPRARR